MKKVKSSPSFPFSVFRVNVAVRASADVVGKGLEELKEWVGSIVLKER